jgi:hypothetical protein
MGLSTDPLKELSTPAAKLCKVNSFSDSNVDMTMMVTRLVLLLGWNDVPDEGDTGGMWEAKPSNELSSSAYYCDISRYFPEILDAAKYWATNLA